MANASEELLEKAVPYFEYDQFANGVRIKLGYFRDVYKYEWKNCNLTVVLKYLNVEPNFTKVEVIKKILKCAYIHPNIIEFYGITKDISKYCMIFQFASDGNLQEYLRKNFLTLEWIDKLRIANEIVFGLIFLHNNNIVHQNLHSRNILIHNGQTKIADIGLAKLKDVSSWNDFMGNFKW